MKRITLVLLALIGLSAISTAQQDPHAKSILDKLSAKTKHYQSIDATFAYTMVNKANGINETQNGQLITKGNQYYLSLAGQQIYCNGTTIWTYLSGSNEVQINNVPKAGEKASNYINPSSIFTIYDKGFKYAYKGMKTTGGKVYEIIDLYPKEPQSKNYHTIVLSIDKTKNEINAIEIKGKDGTNYTYKVKTFITNKNLSDSQYTFNKAKHPGVDVTDLR